MTRRELIEKKGWTKETAKQFVGGYWNFESWWKNQDSPACRYDLLCDLPFYKLNKLYNEAYAKVFGLGSLYDWLEEELDNDNDNDFDIDISAK